MSDASGNPSQPPPAARVGAAIDGAINELAEHLGGGQAPGAGEGGTAGISGPESYYLLPDNLLALIKPALAVLGFPVEEQPVTMYEYDPTNNFNFHRFPIKDDGYIALIYLRNRLTETYLPTSNLAPLYDMLVDLNENLKIRGVIFISDGDRVDGPFRTMANTWVRRGKLQVVDFIDKPYTDSLQRMSDPAQRRIFIQRYMDTLNLKPRTPQPDPGPGVPPAPPPKAVQDLSADIPRMNALEQALIRYLNRGHPATTAQVAATTLINATAWPDDWKNTRIGALSGSANTDARPLIDYAIDQGTIPGTTITALGNLLDRMRPALGGGDLTTVDQIIAEFHLL
jgi:hypothetical protein